MPLVCMMDDSIVMHDIVDVLLLIQFKQEMVAYVNFDIDTNIHTSIEGLARKCQPSVIGTFIKRLPSNDAHLQLMRMMGRGIRRR